MGNPFSLISFHVAGDINADDILRLNAHRGNTQEYDEDTSRLALPNMHED